MNGRHFLDIDAVAPDALRSILTAASARKAARPAGGRATPDDDRPLAGKMLAMIFEKPSTRTRVSFDLGMRQLGGETMVLNGAEMQFGHGESVADTARVLSRYVDAIMIRTFEHEKLMELVQHATVPVINGLTDRTHPCQIMADVMTFEEWRGPIAGRRIVWMGDGNNVCASFIQAAVAFGFDLVFCGPPALDPAPDILAAGGDRVTIERDPEAAVKGADAIVADTWLSMNDPEHTRARRHNLLRPYQVDERMMAAAGGEPVFLHCLPAHRGEEVTDAVMDGPNSAVFDEAENRLHAQKSILTWCLG